MHWDWTFGECSNNFSAESPEVSFPAESPEVFFPAESPEVRGDSAANFQAITQHPPNTTHKKNPPTSLSGDFFMWSRGDSNPCPNIATIGFLHAYFIISCRLGAGNEQTNPQLSWMVLHNSHSLLLWQSVFVLSRRRNLVTDQPVRRPK